MNTCKKDLEAVLIRIKTKGIRAEDIKFNDRLTPQDILSIPKQVVFDWVKSGSWSTKDFNKWFHITKNFSNKGE